MAVKRGSQPTPQVDGGRSRQVNHDAPYLDTGLQTQYKQIVQRQAHIVQQTKTAAGNNQDKFLLPSLYIKESAATNNVVPINGTFKEPSKKGFEPGRFS